MELREQVQNTAKKVFAELIQKGKLRKDLSEWVDNSDMIEKLIGIIIHRLGKLGVRTENDHQTRQIADLVSRAIREVLESCGEKRRVGSSQMEWELDEIEDIVSEESEYWIGLKLQTYSTEKPTKRREVVAAAQAHRWRDKFTRSMDRLD